MKMETVNTQPVQQLPKKALSKSMNKIVPAGGISKRAVEMSQQEREAQMRIRTYKGEDDLNREIEYRDALNRIDQGYKRVYNENSWNEQKRLVPKYQMYHHLNHRFRKSPRDLEMVKSQEREDKFQFDKSLALESKQESRERYAARQLERTLLQSKADQPLSEQSKLEALSLQSTDPILALELLQKKKWRNVQKDPTRMMNNQTIDTTSYWPFLNDLPRKSVGNIVTDYVVKVDKEGCERILGKILDQKQSEENKRNKQQSERAQLRQQLKSRHNKQMMLEKYCGVRLGSLRQKNTKNDHFSPQNYMETFSDANPGQMIEGQSKQEFSNELSSIEIKTPSFKDTIQSKMATLRTTNPNKLQINDEQFQFKFSPKRESKNDNPREVVLALPKPEYQGRDFFWRSEFRGLILADYQEAVGNKAFKCVNDINKSTVSQFSQLKSFQDSIDQKKKIQTFYSQSRQESQRTKRPQLDQSNFTTLNQSLLSMKSPIDLTLASSQLVQQKIHELQSKVRCVTAADGFGGGKDKRTQSTVHRVTNGTILDTESAFRPKTTLNSAFNQSEEDNQGDRIFKNDPAKLETIDERLSFWQRPTKTAHAQRQTTATTIVEQELSNLNSELKDFESRLGCENGNSGKGANRYPNVQLQKVFHPKTSHSTRNKSTTLQSTLII